MTGRLFRCRDCGLLYLRESPPDACACGSPDYAPVGYSELVDAALVETDTGVGEDAFKSAADYVPDGEEVAECPECGAEVDPDDITHYLGGASCPECR